jgi:hypothetical protein
MPNLLLDKFFRKALLGALDAYRVAADPLTEDRLKDYAALKDIILDEEKQFKNSAEMKSALMTRLNAIKEVGWNLFWIPALHVVFKESRLKINLENVFKAFPLEQVLQRENAKLQLQIDEVKTADVMNLKTEIIRIEKENLKLQDEKKEVEKKLLLKEAAYSQLKTEYEKLEKNLQQSRLELHQIHQRLDDVEKKVPLLQEQLQVIPFLQDQLLKLRSEIDSVKGSSLTSSASKLSASTPKNMQ